jgi:hypothetical protein
MRSLRRATLPTLTGFLLLVALVVTTIAAQGRLSHPRRSPV